MTGKEKLILDAAKLSFSLKLPPITLWDLWVMVAGEIGCKL